MGEFDNLNDWKTDNVYASQSYISALSNPFFSEGGEGAQTSFFLFYAHNTDKFSTWLCGE